MNMDINKICRCCMALNGPLMSIYDGGSAGSGCVADMLRGIATLRPQQNDNMPEKVCLSCISEINRCYVFKIKCENSNRTLRQLLPNAVKEHFDKPPSKAYQSDASIQTDETPTKSIQVQTLSVQMPVVKHKEIQADVDASVETPAHRNSLESPPETKSHVIDKVHTRTTKKKLHDDDTSTAKARKQCFKKTRMNESPQQLPKEDTKHNTYIVIEDTTIASRSSQEQKLIIQHICKDEQDDKSVQHIHYPEYYDVADSVNDKDNIRHSAILQESDFTSEEANAPFNENFSDGDCNTPSLLYISPKRETSDVCNMEDNKPNGIAKRSLNQRREQYKCSFCIMSFVSLKVFRRHLAKRHDIADTDIVLDEVPATIEVSDETSQSQDSGINQQVELTMDNVPNPRLLPRGRVSPKRDTPQMHTNFNYFCEYCMAGFVQRKTLAYHMKQKNCMSDNFKCNQCDRIFISEETLDKHMETHNTQYACLECNKECGTIEQLSEHMIEEHNRNARNQCHICKKVFTMRASLMDHLRIHSGEKPFLCTVCGKGFAQNSNLRQHLMRHTNEKNFKCDMCPKAYVTKAELFSHKRTHTGDHPFKCDICSATFTSSSSLLKHKRKHTGERPYECEFCPMRFAALNVLKNHQRTHTGEKPYKCSFCEKNFTQKGDCLLHQRTHEAGDVVCFCGTKFSKMANLRQHLKTQHTNMTDEKRKELDEAICRQKTNNKDMEYLITLTDENDGSGDTEENTEIFTVHNVEDDITLTSQGNVDEVSDIIIEEDLRIE